MSTRIGSAAPTAVSAPSSAGSVQTATRLLNRARAELGYREGPNNYNKFSPALGMQNVPWCAAFVSSMLQESGAGAGILQHGGSASVAGLQQQFAAAGRLRPASYTPQPGDVIFFNPSHTGIVEKVENGVIYTIEGNTSDSVARRQYPVGSGQVAGFGQTVGERIPEGADTGAPANLASLATKVDRSNLPAGSRPTGYEGAGPANRPEVSWYWRRLLQLMEEIDAGAGAEQVAATLMSAFPSLSAGDAGTLATALTSSPELASAVKADGAILGKIVESPELMAMLKERDGVSKVLARVSSPDQFRPTAAEDEAAVGPVLSPPQKPVEPPKGASLPLNPDRYIRG